jgi:hypothetical protein
MNIEKKQILLAFPKELIVPEKSDFSSSGGV